MARARLQIPGVIVAWALWWLITAMAYSIIGVGANSDFMVIQPGETPEQIEARRHQQAQERRDRAERHKIWTCVGAVLLGAAAAALGRLRAGYGHWLPLALGVGLTVSAVLSFTDPLRRAHSPLEFTLAVGLATGTLLGVATTLVFWRQQRLITRSLEKEIA